MNRLDILTTSYQPGTSLDDEIAALAYAAVSGWPDQRPVTAAIVRSHLLARSVPAPDPVPVSSLLLTCRDSLGSLIGAAALRPSTPEGTSTLWGPLIRPTRQRRGLGRHLLDTITQSLPAIPHDTRTSEIPVLRPAAARLFLSAGWQVEDEFVQYTRRLPFATSSLSAAPPDILVRPSHPGESLHARLGALSRRCAPNTLPAIAEATYARWISDERFTHGCLVLAERDTSLLGAALVYPLAHTHPSEPTEAQLADVLIDPSLGHEDVILLHRSLARAALTAAHTQAGASIVRAMARTNDIPTWVALTGSGFTPRGLLRRYRPSAARSDQRYE
jgi:hypothetical protein